VANLPPTSAKETTLPAEAPNLAEFKTRVTQIRARHTRFYDAGRHIESECEICWFIKTIEDLVVELEKR